MPSTNLHALRCHGDEYKQVRRKTRNDHQKIAIHLVHSHRMFQMINIDQTSNLLTPIDHYQYACQTAAVTENRFINALRMPLLSVRDTAKMLI